MLDRKIIGFKKNNLFQSFSRPVKQLFLKKIWRGGQKESFHKNGPIAMLTF
jgi:hypothetical protein